MITHFCVLRVRIWRNVMVLLLCTECENMEEIDTKTSVY